MVFADVQGLTEIKSQFIDAINKDHVAHAQLFLGANGSPNLPMALAYATYLNCTNRQPDDACGLCHSCLKMKKFIHPDLHFVFPVSSTKEIAAKDAISINFLKPWRNYLSEYPFGNVRTWSNYFGGENKQLNISREESRNIIKALALKSFEGNFKIMLIWLPEFMHITAANAILKILEEPPDKTVFLLVTDDGEKLISTILSRVQTIKIRKFSIQEIRQILINNHQVEEKKAEHLSRLSDGDYNRAMDLLSEVEEDSHDMFREWMRLCYAGELSKLVDWSDQFQKMNKEMQKTLLEYGLFILRETLVTDQSHNGINYLQGEDLEFVQNFKKVLNFEMVEKISYEINQCYFHLERNANPKILFLDLSLFIAKVMNS